MLPAPPSSPQHAAVVPRSSCLCRCNASRDAAGPAIIPAACRGGTAVPIPHLYRHPAKLSAPQGSHYSITAGERSEPAESGPHHHRPQVGRTLVVCGYPAPASFGWQLSTGLLPWLAVQSVCPFDPLGAVHIYVWLFVRGFAMLTRGGSNFSLLSFRLIRPNLRSFLAYLPEKWRGNAGCFVNTTPCKRFLTFRGG